MGKPPKLLAEACVRALNREDAENLLRGIDDVTFQRKWSPTISMRYTADMNAGKWVGAVGEVTLDGKSRLINGQHVLRSFLRSNMEWLIVKFVVNRYPGAFDVYDQNRKRRGRDALKAAGYDQPGDIEGICTVLFQYYRGSFNGKRWTAARAAEDFPSISQIIETAEKCSGLNPHLHKPGDFKGCGCSISAIRAASYVLHQIDGPKAKKFFDSFLLGVNIASRQEPIAVLRSAFLAKGEKRLRNGETLAAIFKAWELWLAGKTVKGSLIRRSEDFPDPLHRPSEEGQAQRVQ